MRLKDNNNPFIHVNPPYQLMVIHSSKLVYPRELYQRGVERKRVELMQGTSTSTSLTSRRSASATAGTM